jgi:drug/metabolite transporter (DMT)-like permease
MARTVAAAILIPLAFIGRRERPPSRRGPLRLAVIAGVADIVATLAIMFALQRGTLVILGVLGGLYPVVTILLARFVLDERMGALQKVAVGLAMFAILLIAIG